MQKCQLFVMLNFWREVQSGLEAIEVFLEVMIYVLHTVYKGCHAGMPRNGHLESKTPHCALVQIGSYRPEIIF